MVFSVVEWIQKDPTSSKSFRLIRENYWIWTFRSLHPYGLNQMMKSPHSKLGQFTTPYIFIMYNNPLMINIG